MTGCCTSGEERPTAATWTWAALAIHGGRRGAGQQDGGGYDRHPGQPDQDLATRQLQELGRDLLAT
jgi:hypothetical protein